MAELECDKLIKRDITISDCEEANPDDCNRSYFIYFPTIICNEQNSSTDVGDNLPTLPLVFAIHCFGCSAATMFPSFIQHANEHNFVLVVPEGINHSWNARHCCGYALDNQLDDVGFISNIQSTLGDKYAFVKPQFTYATGWSNGGFMVMHASELFRGIAPIAGFIAGINRGDMTSGGGGKPLFIHQGMDDPFVRPTGCCDDPNLPKCCCNIAADTCTGAIDVTRNWAVEVNGCPNDEKLLVETSYTNVELGIRCLTSSNCMANTTICTYERSGHFNKPSFEKAFPMASDVMNFFARDACEVNDGKWNGIDRTCLCNTKFSGPFCLDAVATRSTGTTSTSRVFATIIVLIMLVLAVSFVMIQKLRRHGRKNERGGKYTKVEYDIEIANQIGGDEARNPSDSVK